MEANVSNIQIPISQTVNLRDIELLRLEGSRVTRATGFITLNDGEEVRNYRLYAKQYQALALLKKLSPELELSFDGRIFRQGTHSDIPALVIDSSNVVSGASIKTPFGSEPHSFLEKNMEGLNQAVRDIKINNYPNHNVAVVYTPKQELLAEPVKEIAHQQPHTPKTKAPSAIGTHVKGGALGLAGAGIAYATEAHKGVGAGLTAAQEAIMPGSTTVGNNFCKLTGNVVGNVAGAVGAASVGSAAFVGGTAASAPLLGPAAPVAGGAAAMAAGGATFSVTQPAVSNLTEFACSKVLPDSVKQAASKALAALDSALTFGGDTKVAQHVPKEQASKGKGAQVQ